MVMLAKPPLPTNYPFNSPGFLSPGQSVANTMLPWSPSATNPTFRINLPSSSDQLSLNPSLSPITNPEGLPQTTHLSNGTTANALFMPNRQQSSIYLSLPLSPELSANRMLLSKMLLNGSDETRQRVETLRNDGISLMVSPFLPGKLIVAMHGPAGKEREMAQAMLTLLLNPKWTPADFEQTRQNITHSLEDFSRKPNLPLKVGMNRALYGENQPYSLTPNQEIALMAQQTPQNLRTALQRVTQATSSAMISIAAPLPTGLQLAILDQATQETGWLHNPFAAAKTPEISSAVSPQAFQKMLFIPSDTLKRAQIELTFQAPPPGDRDYPAFLLLKNILAGHSEGSLFERLRTQDGLVYAAMVYGGMPLGQQSRYNASIEVDFDKIGPAASELMAITRQLASQPVSGATLETAKRRFLLTTRNSEQTASGTLASNMPWMTSNLPPPPIAAMQNAIASITPADIQRISQRIFNTPNSIQLLGISAPSNVLRQWFPNAPIISPPLFG